MRTTLKALKRRVSAAYKSGMTAEESITCSSTKATERWCTMARRSSCGRDEAFAAAVEQLNEWKVKLRAENLYMDTIPWEQERKQREKLFAAHRERDKEARMAAAARRQAAGAAPAADKATPAADEPPPPPAVVVTGCCGRIGRAVANGLVEAGYTVYGFDRLEQTDVPGGLSPEVIYQNGTLAHRARLRRVIRKATAVVHLAACPDDAPFDTVLLPTNILGLMNVLSECESAHQQAEEGTSKLEVVVVASTGKLYASPSTPFPIKVNDPFGVVCNYGASKLFAEGASQAFAHRTSIPTTVLRFGWCPRTKGDLAAMREKSKENAPGEGMNEFSRLRTRRAACLRRSRRSHRLQSSSARATHKRAASRGLISARRQRP